MPGCLEFKGSGFMGLGVYMGLRVQGWGVLGFKV